MEKNSVKKISGKTESENNKTSKDRPNIIKQFLWTFLKPKQLYENVKIKPLLFVPILIALISGLFTGLKSSSYSIDPGMMGQLSPQQAEQISQMMNSGAFVALTVFSQLISEVAGLFISAVIIYLFIKVFKGKGTFAQSVSFTGFAFAPLMVHSILRFLFSAPADMSQILNTTLTFFGALKNVMFSTGIIFIVWIVILMIIGLNRIFEMPKKRAAACALTYYILNIIFSAVISLISVNSISAMGL